MSDARGGFFGAAGVDPRAALRLRRARGDGLMPRARDEDERGTGVARRTRARGLWPRLTGPTALSRPHLTGFIFEENIILTWATWTHVTLTHGEHC